MTTETEDLLWRRFNEWFRARRPDYPAEWDAYQAGHAAAKAETAAAVAKEMDRCIGIIESHHIPVGNSAAGEMACEWTYDALKTIRAAIRSGAPPDTLREAGAVAGGAA